AAEGAVLLKNENNFLPLKNEENVAVFGRCQFDYYRSGTGSGGAVNVEYTTDFINSLISRNRVNVNQVLYNTYKEWLVDNPFNKGDGSWASEPWSQVEMFLSDEIVSNAAKISDKAIIIIGRTAGEDKDNFNEAGSYLLTNEELDMIDKVCAQFNEVGVIINVSNIIDMSWENDKINMLIYAWHGGMEGGNAIVDVVLGDVTPSGKLPDTIAYNIDDYPSTKNHGGSTQNIYEEDIYVGYRYFETFAQDKVKYPFGYGLSYTTFDIDDFSLGSESFIPKSGTSNLALSGVEISLKVTNTGNTYSGKEVVQIYLEAPMGKLGRPKRELIAFAKTKLLKPGQSETLSISIPVENMATFDDSGITGYKSAYVLEKGAYKFYTKTTTFSGSINIDNTIVVEQLEEALAPSASFKRIKPKVGDNGNIDIDFEDVPTQTINLANRINSRMPKEIVLTGDKGYKLNDVKKNKISMEKFIAQLSKEDLEIIVRGEGMSHPNVTPGTASAFGGVSTNLRNFGIPLMCSSDGPSGIRMESGLCATLMPIGTLLAATWDTALIEQLYEMEGQELSGNCIELLLGPGINIHRNPLNGRNFEYYSEDPLLTGKIAAAVVRGIRKGGAEATLKHFACNSQETFRHEINAVISERALREIYLKGFEIAIKEGGAHSVMTAYNPINGHWTASNYDLTTTILRKEWKFDGIVMTDWWARMNDVIDGGKATRQDLANMVKAQNDVYMVVGNYGAEINDNEDNIAQYLANGKLSLAELQRCAMNICKFALNTQALRRGELLFGKPHFFKACSTIEGAKSLVDNSIHITTEKTHSFYFDQSGEYQVNVSYFSNAKGIGQTTCNVFLNDALMTTIQIGNTHGKTPTKKLADIQLEKGFYTLRLDFVSSELEIKKITFININ
ncbi:beta-glucosidase, partial [Candidatus Epulonipiscioides gigas]